MREDAADQFPQSTVLANVGNAPPPASNLAALLAAEKLAQKRPNASLDPSRQLPDYLRNQGRNNANAVASGSSNNAVAGGSRNTTNSAAVRYLICPHHSCLTDVYSRTCVSRQRSVPTRIFLKRAERHLLQAPRRPPPRRPRPFVHPVLQLPAQLPSPQRRPPPPRRVPCTGQPRRPRPRPPRSTPARASRMPSPTSPPSSTRRFTRP
jgi:hypothetical protein